MHVLVTGGSGTIGTFVLEELQRRGHDVTVFDVREPRVEGVEYVDGNVTDNSAVVDAIAGVDAIVHMAALLPPACAENPRRAERVNVGGTVNVLDAADEETRVVVISSKAVFGSVSGQYAHPTYEPLSESAPQRPQSVYGLTKYACEGYCRAFVRRGLDVAAVRFASTYGPGKGSEYGNFAFVSRAIESARRNETVHLPGGDQLDDLVYFGDVARGVADVVEADALNYGAYHIGSNTLTSPHDIARSLERETSATVHVEDGLDYRKGEYQSYCLLDTSRVRSDLGYEPEFSIEDGITDCLDRT